LPRNVQNRTNGVGATPTDLAQSPTMAKAKQAVAVSYKQLVGLLGKPPKDPAVTAVLATAGKVTIKPDFIIAKEAGFDFSLGRPEGAKRNAPKVLSTLFLFADGADGHRGYRDLPRGFAFTTRDELIGALPAPVVSWKIGKGKVPVATDGVSHDTWLVDGIEVTANYRGSSVGHINVSLPDDATGGTDLSTNPLHFATKPVDAPPDAELVGMALLVAWAATRFGLPAKHAGSALGKQLVAREITPRGFLVGACDRRLTSLDVDPKLADFLYEYEHHLVDDEGARDDADTEIAKLLGFDDPSRRNFDDDFRASFTGVVENPFHIPDSWAAVDRLAPVLDARLADYQATGFTKAPDLALYKKAAKLRDAVSVTPDRAAAAAAPTADAKLADELVALIGRSLKDAAVKAVITRAGMPIGKKIDQQANPALGVAYMGTNFEIDGKKQLGVDAVWFFAAKQKSYIRGIGAEVEFAGYPGPLPRGLALGEARAAVTRKLGAPTRSSDDGDYWEPSPSLRLSCTFEGDKLVRVYFGQPKNY
jgi:hypothetical protein